MTTRYGVLGEFGGTEQFAKSAQANRFASSVIMDKLKGILYTYSCFTAWSRVQPSQSVMHYQILGGDCPSFLEQRAATVHT